VRSVRTIYVLYLVVVLGGILYAVLIGLAHR
jgi:hypothetical protein